MEILNIKHQNLTTTSLLINVILQATQSENTNRVFFKTVDLSGKIYTDQTGIFQSLQAGVISISSSLATLILTPSTLNPSIQYQAWTSQQRTRNSTACWPTEFCDLTFISWTMSVHIFYKNLWERWTKNSSWSRLTSIGETQRSGQSGLSRNISSQGFLVLTRTSCFIYGADLSHTPSSRPTCSDSLAWTPNFPGIQNCMGSSITTPRLSPRLAHKS